MRLARADFTVRLERNYKKDLADTLAYFVNLIAEELERMMAEREREKREHEAAVVEFNEAFLGLAAGNFDVRVRRTGNGSPLDVLAYLVNNTAVEVGAAFGELDSQRQVLATILESMIDGVLLLDRAGKIRSVNAALCRLLGETGTQLEGRLFETILAPDEAPFAASLAALAEQGSFRDRELRFRAASGEHISMTVNGSPNRDATGELTGIVLVARDDRELRRAQVQLQTNERLAAMGRVAAGVAHEINNPLAYVAANLEFVEDELLRLSPSKPLDDELLDELRRAVGASRGGAERVKQIVKDLKSLSRVEGESVGRIDLRKLLETAATMLQKEIRSRARLSLELGPSPEVVANEGRILQVFLNLLQNGAQAIPPGAPEQNLLRVRTAAHPDGGALVEVTDSGSGIAPENLQRIFDAFFTTKKVGEGTGLGLSICHNIISAAGGRIEVDTELGKGTTFRVVFPAAATAQAEATATPAAEGAARAGRLNILVVDDEADVRDSLRRLLREHDVTLAPDGREAAALLAQRSFDAVLCDLSMPRMDGIELHAWIAERRPELLPRVGFMTGDAISERAKAFIAKLERPVLEKPFDNRQLDELLRGLTE